MRLLNIKRRLFTRCAGCGGWSTKANPVNTRIGNSVSAPLRPWDSEVELFHGSCACVASRARRRLVSQLRAQAHWRTYSLASHLSRQIDEGTLDRNDVAGKLREVAEHERAEFGKIIKQGEE